MTIKYQVKDLNLDNISRVLELNEQLVHVLSPMDENLLKELYEMSEIFKVIEVDDNIIAFLIVIREGKKYGSLNYQWFMKNYEKFLYIDRVVVDPNYHRAGIGRILYNEVIKKAQEEAIGVVSAEIDIFPENITSLKFHKRFNFKEVGKQFVADGKKQVSLQILEI